MCETEIAAVPLPRRESVAVRVGSGRGAVIVGGGAPIVVQSMTNTDTADVDSTVAAGRRSGAGRVRTGAHHRGPRRGRRGGAANPRKTDNLGVIVPLVGDFHYIGHKLLTDHPACAEALAKYRINPGNVGFKEKKDKQFAAIVELAIKHDKAVRIGANWGSLDQEMLTHLMDENAHSGAADRCPRCDARSAWSAPRCSPPNGRKRSALGATASSSRPKSPACRT